jgi:hypothetical protein
MCFGIITIYPAVKGFDFCAHWKDLPDCSITNYDVYDGCNRDTLEILLDPISKICYENCSEACQITIDALRSTDCWEGQLKEYIEHFWPMLKNESLGNLFDIIENCSNVLINETIKITGNPPQEINELSTQANIENNTQETTETATEINTQAASSTSTQEISKQATQINTQAASPKHGVPNACQLPQMTNNSAMRLICISANLGYGFIVVVFFALRT